MKLLMYSWMLILPFVLQLQCGHATPVFMLLVSVGFFGLDQVAEILESPFGNDPNDIDLIDEAEALMNDICGMCIRCCSQT